jgi:hypothetical protein
MGHTQLKIQHLDINWQDFGHILSVQPKGLPFISVGNICIHFYVQAFVAEIHVQKIGEQNWPNYP